MNVEWFFRFGEINWVGAIVALFAILLLGFLWYHWAAFGKVWATSLGMTKEEADNVEGMGKVFSFSIVGGALKVIFMSLLLNSMGINSVMSGMLFGVFVSFGFVATSIIYHDGFARRLNKATAVNIFHDIVEFGLIGAIYCLF